MVRRRLAFIVLLSVPALLVAQAPSSPDNVVRLGPGVTAPRLLHKTEPEYTHTALDARVQGTVVLQLIVDEQGRATDITVLNPVGFGLDERAADTVSSWRFTPAIKDGRPVKILATVEVNFRLNGVSFDQAAENRRAKFNANVRILEHDKSDSAAVQRAVTSMQDLARRKYPPAMFAIGIWEINGEHIAKDLEDGLRLVRASAAKDYAPAICEVAIRLIEGQDLAPDPEKGWKQLRDAAVLGSQRAQLYLGDHYERGAGVTRETGRAQRYFHLCATTGNAACQYRLARILLAEAERPERDYVQAVAWLQLASERRLADARDAAARETAALTPSQSDWVKTLKAQLLRKD